MAFASVQDLANFMQATVTNSAATLALNIATSRIQGECGQMFTYVADDDVILPGGSSTLILPNQPVISIASISTVDLFGEGPTSQVLGSTWAHSGGVLTWLGGAPRLNGSPALPYLSDVWPYAVRVVYTHGYATIPDDVKGCCLMLAAENYTSPGGEHYQSIDDFAWRRGNADATPAALALKALKARYGRSIHSLRVSR